jgi:glucosylglycerol-phosphate synthase
MDESIDEALAMSPEEQKVRMGRMYQAIKRYDVQQWANHLFREARATAILGEEPAEQEPALV